MLDSTADIRSLVLPRRPPGTGGLSEDELRELVDPRGPAWFLISARTPGEPSTQETRNEPAICQGQAKGAPVSATEKCTTERVHRYRAAAAQAESRSDGA